MRRLPQVNHSSEAGYTLIELLTVIVIIGVLSSLSIASFKQTRQDAHYKKAVATLRNAVTAINVGEMDLAEGASVAYSTTDPGGEIAGSLAAILPGAVNSDGVVLGAGATACDDSAGALDINLLVIAQPCYADRQARWLKFCDGTALLLENLAGGASCS